MKNDKRNAALQSLCRDYLTRLYYIANKYGLGTFVKEMLKANRRGECEATEKEVMMLSRCVNDERVSRTDVPKLLGKSYRECFESNDFDKIKKLPHVGIYSKVSTLLYGASKKNKNNLVCSK